MNPFSKSISFESKPLVLYKLVGSWYKPSIKRRRSDIVLDKERRSGQGDIHAAKFDMNLVSTKEIFSPSAHPPQIISRSVPSHHPSFLNGSCPSERAVSDSHIRNASLSVFSPKDSNLLDDLRLHHTDEQPSFDKEACKEPSSNAIEQSVLFQATLAVLARSQGMQLEETEEERRIKMEAKLHQTHRQKMVATKLLAQHEARSRPFSWRNEFISSPSSNDGSLPQGEPLLRKRPYVRSSLSVTTIAET